MSFVSANSIEDHDHHHVMSDDHVQLQPTFKSCSQQKLALVVFKRTLRNLQELWTLPIGFEAKLLIEHDLMGW